MKRIFIVIVIICITLSLFSQEKKIAMLETIGVTSTVSPMIKDMVRTELTKAIASEKGYKAFVRTELDQVMSEFNFQNSGLIKDEQRVQVGEMSGADYVCVSKVSKDGNSYYIQASLINIVTGEFEGNGSFFIEGGLADVNNACKKVARELLGLNMSVEKHEEKAAMPIQQTVNNLPQIDNVTTVKDIDDNVYNVVVIENQRWLAENLKTTRYNDGSQIYCVNSSKEWKKEGRKKSMYAYYKFESSFKSNYAIFYNWHAVANGNLCPQNWHVATDADWASLNKFLLAIDKKDMQGLAIKSKTRWNVTGNDSFGFNALPTSYCNEDGEFNEDLKYANWWTSTNDDDDEAWSWQLNDKNQQLNRKYQYKTLGFPVRCVKD